ncbi:hypothetical protein PVAP13_9NG498500 [Panicum virgatum]|uniref:Uncharacterized protein n=1 Tax=Panicum virgatum TaxID=38727 RepID=A0A8T0MTA5_PANVG|nr:hypothetical protein PVAP13_9NG498500 [Panicum virgatum]
MSKFSWHGYACKQTRNRSRDRDPSRKQPSKQCPGAARRRIGSHHHPSKAGAGAGSVDPVIHAPRAYASRGSGGSDMGFSEGGGGGGGGGGGKRDDDDDGRHARDRESEEEVAVWLPVGAAGRPPD